MTEVTVTDPVVEDGKASDVKNDLDLNEEVKIDESKKTEEGIVTGEVTDPLSDGKTVEPEKKPDAQKADTAFKFRSERRGRLTAEGKVNELEAKITELENAEPVIPVVKPKEENFENTADFIEAITDWKIEQIRQGDLVQARKNQKAESERLAGIKGKELQMNFDEKLEAAIERTPDIKKVLSEFELFTDQTVALIQESDIGPELGYHVAKNPVLANQLNEMSPVQAARELGRLEVSLKAAIKRKSVSNAPEPITPVGGEGDKASKTETTKQYIDRKNKEEYGST